MLIKRSEPFDWIHSIHPVVLQLPDHVQLLSGNRHLSRTVAIPSYTSTQRPALFMDGMLVGTIYILQIYSSNVVINCSGAPNFCTQSAVESSKMDTAQRHRRDRPLLPALRQQASKNGYWLRLGSLSWHDLACWNTRNLYIYTVCSAYSCQLEKRSRARCHHEKSLKQPLQASVPSLRLPARQQVENLCCEGRGSILELTTLQQVATVKESSRCLRAISAA